MKANMKENNLQEIYQFLLQKYQDDINRKERLENKALGYLTMLSITLAVSTTVFIAILQSFNHNDIPFIFLVLFFFGQIYFAV
jgi:archaellum biogenesis protein FlaJ (TadC family)